MENRNGFFQLNIKDDGTYIRLYPPVGEGKQVTFDEINNYLFDINIFDFNLNELGEAINKSATSKVEVKLLSIPIKPENESFKIRLSTDKMYAIARFYPPTNNGKTLKANDIVIQLKNSGVINGICNDIIDGFINSKRYCEDIVVAKGTKQIEGSDAVITYHFNTDNSLRPKINEDGTVDFHQLDIISSINKGDVLATLVPAVQGTAGTDVNGNVLQPRKVNRKLLRHGKDIYLSEDGLTMYSAVSGHATLTDERVFVSNTYEVLGDVDSSTGDIVYEGNVTVKGNVITGFTIQARGDIIVNGVVEGANLIAGGHIILKRGMQGMSKGKMIASGNIVTKFIENSTVKAGGYVTTEAILHSKVNAVGEVIVGGRKGFITGGEIRSGVGITVKTAGSTMGTSTLFEVGIDPARMEEFRDLEKKISKMKIDLDKLMPIVESYRKKINDGDTLAPNIIDYVRTAARNCLELRTDLKNAIKDYELLQIALGNNERAFVKVENIAYPGVKIIISNVSYFIKKEVHYSKFIRDKADIKIVGL